MSTPDLDELERRFKARGARGLSDNDAAQLIALARRAGDLEKALEQMMILRNPEDELLAYARACIRASETIGRELLDEDLCRLSRVFGRYANFTDDRDRRINDRLKAMISEIRAALNEGDRS